MPSLAAEWRSFREEVLTDETELETVRETRWAFYAGATVLLTTLLDAIGEERVLDERVLRLLDGWKRESVAFILDLARGLE
jgi:hypothetical protein